MLKECLFCRMVSGELPVPKLLETDTLFVVKDINPLAPVHLLVIPKEHWSTLMDLPESRKDILGDIFLVARKIAKDLGIDEQGFRIIHNVKEWGGQKVMHLHFHVLGGIKFD